jgi:hypothetical protein
VTTTQMDQGHDGGTMPAIGLFDDDRSAPDTSSD